MLKFVNFAVKTLFLVIIDLNLILIQTTNLTLNETA